MNELTMANILSFVFIAIGLFLWFWGTIPLFGKRSLLYKIHGLSVADNLGSIAITFGLLLKIPNEWSILVLAIISLSIWNTILGYVLAYCSRTEDESIIHSLEQ